MNRTYNRPLAMRVIRHNSTLSSLLPKGSVYILKQSSSKSLEKKLERKRADLATAIETRQQIDQKIKKLREEIDTLQSTQLEQVFQQVKKSILKEGLHLDAEAIPGILQTIREKQDEGVSPEHTPKEKNETAEQSNDRAISSPYDESDLPQEEETGSEVTTYSGSRLP